MTNNALKGRKILIVEDDFAGRLYLNKVLEKHEVVLFNADNGADAVSIARDNPDIEIILMDLQIPKIDGYTATSQIRQFRDKIIIIAQTANNLSGDRQKILSSGFDDYLVKPIMSEELIRKLNSFLK